MNNPETKRYEAIIVNLARREVATLDLAVPVAVEEGVKAITSASVDQPIAQWGKDDINFLVDMMKMYFVHRANGSEDDLVAVMAALAYKRLVPLAEQEQHGVVVL